MKAGLTWSPEFAALKAQLRDMPDTLTTEANHIVEGTANGAAVDIKAIYGQHAISGDLQRSVVVFRREAGRFAARYEVKSTSKLAWLFDNGSQGRHYVTDAGAEHRTGAMWGKTAPTHAFVVTMIRARRAMYDQLKALMTRQGLRVTGDAE
jgi:hypothetical protein